MSRGMGSALTQRMAQMLKMAVLLDLYLLQQLNRARDRPTHHLLLSLW